MQKHYVIENGIIKYVCDYTEQEYLKAEHFSLDYCEKEWLIVLANNPNVAIALYLVAIKDAESEWLKEKEEWSQFSLEQALRGMEDDVAYDIFDIKT